MHRALATGAPWALARGGAAAAAGSAPAARALSAIPLPWSVVPGGSEGGAGSGVGVPLAAPPSSPARALAPWAQRVSEVVARGWTTAAASLQALLGEGILMAVPKRKKSYSRKRMRQFNPVNELVDKQCLYPCPKCDKGLMKQHHHLCPCDMKKLGIPHVETKYGSYTNKDDKSGSGSSGPTPA